MVPVMMVFVLVIVKMAALAAIFVVIVVIGAALTDLDVPTFNLTRGAVAG